MGRFRTLLTLALAGLIGIDLMGAGPCDPGEDAYELAERAGEIRVVGRPYLVPELRLRFSDADTGEQVTPDVVRVFYSGQQLQGWNDFDNFNEIIDCHPQGSSLTIPAFEFRPWSSHRRWYTVLPWRKPRFTHVEISTSRGVRTHRIIIWEKHLKRFRGRTLHVKITRSGQFEYWREAPDGSVDRVERDHGGRYRRRR